MFCDYNCDNFRIFRDFVRFFFGEYILQAKKLAIRKIKTCIQLRVAARVFETLLFFRVSPAKR